MTTNIALTQQLHQAWNENRYDDVLALCAEDMDTVSYSNGFIAKGKDNFRAFFLGFKAAFPDITITHRNIVASGDWVAVEFGATGTNTGTLMTPNGAVPPTGRRVEMSLMAQLGLLPAPAGL